MMRACALEGWRHIGVAKGGQLGPEFGGSDCRGVLALPWKSAGNMKGSEGSRKFPSGPLSSSA